MSGTNSSQRNVIYMVAVGVAVAVAVQQAMRSHDDEVTDAKALVQRAESGDTQGMGPVSAFGAQLIRTVQQRQKDYVAQMDACTPKMAGLLGADSFRSHSAMKQMDESVSACAKLDLDYFEQTIRYYDGVPAQIAQQSWSQSEKDEFLTGFLSTAEATEQQLKNQGQMERSWLDSIHALYGYAQENAAHIRVVNGKVSIDKADVLGQFNTRLQRANTLGQNFVKVHAQANQHIQEVQQQIGLKEKPPGGKP